MSGACTYSKGILRGWILFSSLLSESTLCFVESQNLEVLIIYLLSNLTLGVISCSLIQIQLKFFCPAAIFPEQTTPNSHPRLYLPVNYRLHYLDYNFIYLLNFSHQYIISVIISTETCLYTCLKTQQNDSLRHNECYYIFTRHISSLLHLETKK